MFSRALLTYHLRQLRQSPATGVFLTVGWVAGVLLTFISGQLFATNRAELTALFTILPWVMAVLIPTLTMPVASEYRRGVTERLLTLPHTPTQRLFSRFVVTWGLLGVWLLGFWPLVATLYYLGNPDFGPIATGLFGSWLLAAPLLAISLTICLRARSSVGGLLASLATCLLLLLVGVPTVTGWFAAVPGLGWLPATAHLTLLGVYQSFTTGLLNFSAILLLAGLAVLILGASLASRNVTRRATAPIITGAVITLLALLPLFEDTQLDTTHDKLHTPSPATTNALKQLESPVTFTLYLSQNNPDVPPSVHAYAHSLTNLLLRLRAAAPSKINVKLSNTDLSTNAAVAALQAGATEQSLPTGTTYFAALTASIGSSTQVIPVLNPTRAAVQEYDILSLLTHTQTHTQPVVAVLQNPISSTPLWQKSLQGSFTLNVIPTALGVTEIPSETAVLLLPDDPALPPQTIDAVRTYLNHGGNVVLAADAFTRTPQPDILPTDTRLSTLLPEWGLQLISETIIADPTEATLATQLTPSGGAGASAYPYWLQLTPKNLETTLPFTAGVAKLFLPETGAFTLQPNSAPSSNMTLTPFITSSASARAVPLSVFEATPPELASGNLPAASAPQILAVMVSGPFSEGAPHSGTLVAFADSDWLTNTSINQSPDNLTLLTNLLHYLSGQTGLTTLRAKNAVPRTLTRVEAMANRLTQSTTITEQKIAARLYEVNQHIATRPDDLAAAQEQEFTLREQLRNIRQQTRHSLQMLENALLLLNLALMPTLIGILFFIQRRRQRLRATSTL